MKTLTDYLTLQKTYNDAVVEALNGIQDGELDITGDIAGLNDKITALQNSSGGVTESDAALIDELEAQGAALVAKAQARKDAMAALAALTPPVVPAASQLKQP